MNNEAMKSTIVHHLSAEVKKLKSTPVVYLVGACCVFVIAIIMVAHTLDIINAVRINVNPWKRCFGAGMGIYSFFVMVPFVVLLITAVTFVEQRANAWKLLYTMPVARGNVYFSKLIIIILIVFITSVLLIFGVVGAGYMLDQIFPELEFTYYQAPILNAFEDIIHLLIASLGVIGLQYFMSLWFKNFLVPMSIGIVGYILAFILTTTNTKFVLYLPYTYSMTVKDHGMFKSDHTKEIWNGWLTNVELYSVLCFVLFVGLGYFYERWRNVE